jgi:hypothetical protein
MSGTLYDSFATSSEAETKGVVLEYPDCGGAEIRIARAGGANMRYIKALERASKKHRAQIKNDTLGHELNVRITQEVFAETVVLGWENVTDRAGEPIPFSKANCLQLFKDLPALWEDIAEQANTLALFREQIREEQAKN